MSQEKPKGDGIMMRAMVIYDSNFGNTERIARALAQGLERGGVNVNCLKIDQVDTGDLRGYDFIAIGGPTHMIRPSKPMKEFLDGLGDVDLKGLKGFAFDTRNESRMNGKQWLVLENSAARVIEGVLRRMKVEIVRPRHSAIVEGREGPLNNGTEDEFMEIGAEIASKLL
jgi:flavodoxin